MNECYAGTVATSWRSPNTMFNGCTMSPKIRLRSFQDREEVIRHCQNHLLWLTGSGTWLGPPGEMTDVPQNCLHDNSQGRIWRLLPQQPPSRLFSWSSLWPGRTLLRKPSWGSGLNMLSWRGSSSAMARALDVVSQRWDAQTNPHVGPITCWASLELERKGY